MELAVRQAMELAAGFHQVGEPIGGTGTYHGSTAAIAPSRCSRDACRRIRNDELRNNSAMTAATRRSGHAVAVPHTPSAANITATLPMASLREHSHTERTLASPSL